MRLNLREIIEMPGGSVPFDFFLDPEGLDFPQIVSYKSAPHAVGMVYNEAGMLILTGKLTAEMVCVCDRCCAEFESDKETELHAIIAQEDDGENPDLYVLDGDEIDVDEIVTTNYVLDMETKFLCSPDCKGICPKCGKNLNDGPCGCGKEIDPRFAVLEQLLDK